MKSDGAASQPADPNLAVAVVVKGGTLRLASPELVEPIEAATLDGLADDRPGQADGGGRDPGRRGAVARDPRDLSTTGPRPGPRATSR